MEIGIFVDQKWCNLVPCFFDGVKVLRDPGHNVASWNLSNCVMRFDDEGRGRINGRPLRFYHFTKLGPVGDIMTQRAMPATLSRSMRCGGGIATPSPGRPARQSRRVGGITPHSTVM